MNYGAVAVLLGISVLAGCSGGSSHHASSSDRNQQNDVSSPTTSTDTSDNASDNSSSGNNSGNDSDNSSSSSGDTTVDNGNGDGTTPPDSGETPAPPGFYNRAEEYPYMVTLPMQFITTSSGKKLATYVSMPANQRGVPADGKFPTLLVQTAYNINVSGALKAMGGVLLGAPDPYMVKRGYVQVSVDALGTGSSQGGWEMLGRDEQIAYGDTVDWVKQQPWYNGKLGVAGASYMAISSIFTAEERPDDINAVFASVPMGDALRGTVGTGGMINGLFMRTWLTLTQVTTVENFLSVFRNLKYATQITEATREHTEQIDNYYLPIINDALTGSPNVTFDGEFWRTRSPIENVDKIKAPTMLFGAVDDIFQRDEPLFYEKLKNRVDTRLVIYRGDHISNFVQGAVGVENIYPLPYRALQWFDKYLRGMDTDTASIPPVAQYVKNAGTRFPSGFDFPGDWPHPALTPERWFLHGDMSLSKTAPAAQEASSSMVTAPFPVIESGKSADGSTLIFNVTLNDGSECSSSFRQWTLGKGNITEPLYCSYDNARVEENALNYESDILDEDYYFNGPIQADVFMDSTATEAVLSVRVDEVSKNGHKVVPLTNGLLLASARAVDESRSRFIKGEMMQPFHPFTEAAQQPVVPGQVMKMQVEIFPTSAIVRKGHKLRISIAPSNDAQGILNLPRQAQAAGGVSTVHISPQYPSSVVLPMVPLAPLE